MGIWPAVGPEGKKQKEGREEGKNHHCQAGILCAKKKKRKRQKRKKKTEREPENPTTGAKPQAIITLLLLYRLDEKVDPSNSQPGKPKLTAIMLPKAS